MIELMGDEDDITFCQQQLAEIRKHCATLEKELRYERRKCDEAVEGARISAERAEKKAAEALAKINPDLEIELETIVAVFEERFGRRARVEAALDAKLRLECAFHSHDRLLGGLR